MLDYMINPVLMEGKIRDRYETSVKIQLRGRLGVIELPKDLIVGDKKLDIGDKVRFYFSYIQAVEKAGDYDLHSLKAYDEVYHCLFGGRISMFNDTAVEVKALEDSITIFVPRRWVFTPIELRDGLNVEFYLSAIEFISNTRRNDNEINNSRRYAV